MFQHLRGPPLALTARGKRVAACLGRWSALPRRDPLATSYAAFNDLIFAVLYFD